MGKSLKPVRKHIWNNFEDMIFDQISDLAPMIIDNVQQIQIGVQRIISPVKIVITGKVRGRDGRRIHHRLLFSAKNKL